VRGNTLAYAPGAGVVWDSGDGVLSMGISWPTTH
jgi:hypothetical protein